MILTLKIRILLPMLLRLLLMTNVIVVVNSLPAGPSSPVLLIPEDDFTLYNTSAGTTTQDPRVDSVLTFWFDPRYPYYHWFVADPKFDAEITTKFASLVTRARTTTDLDHWAGSPQGSLALIVVLDQFPRNMFRKSSEAFTSDQKALSIAGAAIDRGFDGDLTFVQQVFVYLPYMHMENLPDQDRGVAMYQSLTARCEAGAPEKEWLDSCVDFAIRHQKVIAEFGRFPARNEALHRQSTPKETEFLKTHPWGY